MLFKKLPIVALTVLSLLLAPLGQIAGAAPAAAPDGLQTYGTPFTASSLSGVFASTQQFFQLQDYWKIGSVKLELDYQASPLTEGDRSSVTLVMNGTPFYSFRPLVDPGKHHLSVPVPGSALVKGFNTLTVQGTIQTAETGSVQLCTASDTRGSWLQIFDTSRVDVGYTPQPLTGTISNFNVHFLGLDTLNDGRNAVVVPDGADASELEAAVYALSGFAQANPLKEKPIPLLVNGTDSLAGKSAVVIVSLYDRLPADIRSQLDGRDLTNKALVKLVNVDRQPTLVVTSASKDQLVRAGRLVGNQTLMKQMTEGEKLVDAGTEVATPPVGISRNVALTETGDKLTGDNHREKTYFISLPGNRSIAEASKLSLDFRYARNLDFDRSMVTILVNNTPIGSKKLTPELADGDSINLPIPKNLDISGNFSITAAFDLQLKSVSCTQSGDQMPWAFISKDSLLQLNTKDQADLLFNNYPYPFLRDGSYNKVAVVLPKERDAYTYRTLSNLFNLLGQYATTNTGDVRFYPESIPADQLKGSQIIAIGTYADNGVIRANNAKLYFQYNDAGTAFRSNEKMSIDSDYGSRIGAVQLIESPYDPGHGLMAVTGAGSEYYYLASKLLARESTLFKVFGDGVVTDKDGNVNAFRFKKEAEPAPPTVISDVLDRGDVLAFMVAAVLVLVLILVSLIFLIRKHRKKGREPK